MDFENDAALFIKNSKDYWVAITSGSSEAANEFERANKLLVDQWALAHTAIDALTVMLLHSESEVRFFAASYLLSLNGDKKAQAILEEIGSQTTGLMPISAATILRVRHARK